MVIPRGINVNHRPEHAELENAELLGGGIFWKYQANMALFVTVHVADGLSMGSGSNMVIPRDINVNHRPEHAELKRTVLLGGGILSKLEDSNPMFKVMLKSLFYSLPNHPRNPRSIRQLYLLYNSLAHSDPIFYFILTQSLT